MDLEAFWIRSVTLLCVLIFAGAFETSAQKLGAEEIVAKHVASIGKSDLLAQSKRVMAVGSSEFVRHRPELKTIGNSVLASNGSDMAFVSTFDDQDYPAERIGIFNDKINIPTVTMGSRSPLGRFLRSYDKVLDGRVFGGCIFSTWFLLGPQRGGKLEVDGKKKVGERDAWVLTYTPKGGLTGGSYIKLFFDAENFQHLRTIYRQKEPENNAFSGTTNTVGATKDVLDSWNTGSANNDFVLTEDFSDICGDIGLTLPHKYSITLLVDGHKGTSEFTWNFAIKEYRLIRDFPADFFTFKSGGS